MFNFHSYFFVFVFNARFEWWCFGYCKPWWRIDKMVIYVTILQREYKHKHKQRLFLKRASWIRNELLTDPINFMTLGL